MKNKSSIISQVILFRNTNSPRLLAVMVSHCMFNPVGGEEYLHISKHEVTQSARAGACRWHVFHMQQAISYHETLSRSAGSKTVKPVVQSLICDILYGIDAERMELRLGSG